MAEFKRLFAPSGLPITRLMIECVSSCNINHMDDGSIEQAHFDDFPTFDDYKTNDGAIYVLDRNGSEFLDVHCRKVTVDGDDYDEETAAIDAWDDDIVTACLRASQLHDGMKALKLFDRVMPHKWLEDPTCAVAVQTILMGRIEGELAEHNRKIDAYRAGRTEIEHVNEMPCSTCAGQGGELLPCDECGAMKDDDDDD